MKFGDGDRKTKQSSADRDRGGDTCF